MKLNAISFMLLNYNTDAAAADNDDGNVVV